MHRTARNAIVVITGAARGMGLLYAVRAASEGARAVVMWDLDASVLQRSASDLRERFPHVTVIAEAVDVTDQTSLDAAVAEVLDGVGPPDILINNAGIVRSSWFWEHQPERDIQATMAVNTIAPMQITRQFLPAMMADASRPRRIVNISSAAALFSTPRMAVYAASKSGLTAWSDSLRLELRGHRNLAVTTVAPSFVSTGMFAGAKAPLITPILRPEYVVDRVWASMLAGKPRLILPWSVYLALALRGLIAVKPFDWLADHVLRINGSMAEFTGRAPQK